jgi:predicted RND superfamily exporter protein
MEKFFKHPWVNSRVSRGGDLIVLSLSVSIVVSLMVIPVLLTTVKPKFIRVV